MKPIKVIIIEDESVIASMYAGKLQREGFQVTIAIDGNAGVAQALRQPPDIILLDIMMPNMNGVEVLTKLRQYPELAKTKIVVLTNVDSPQTDEEVRGLGAVDYLLKANTTPEELCERIKGYFTKPQSPPAGAAQ